MISYFELRKGHKRKRDFHSEANVNYKDISCKSQHCKGTVQSHLNCGKYLVCLNCGNRINNNDYVKPSIQIPETPIPEDANAELTDRAFHGEFRGWGALGWQKQRR